jgi:hypothetical protein
MNSIARTPQVTNGNPWGFPFPKGDNDFANIVQQQLQHIKGAKNEAVSKEGFSGRFSIKVPNNIAAGVALLLVIFKTVQVFGKILFPKMPKEQESTIVKKQVSEAKQSITPIKMGIAILLGLALAFCIAQMHSYYEFTRFRGEL